MTEVKDEFLQDNVKVAGSRGGHCLQCHSKTLYVCSTVSKHRVLDICIFYLAHHLQNILRNQWYLQFFPMKSIIAAAEKEGKEELFPH